MFDHHVDQSPRQQSSDKVVLLIDDDWSPVEIAKVLFIEESTVKAHLKVYREEDRLGIVKKQLDILSRIFYHLRMRKDRSADIVFMIARKYSVIKDHLNERSRRLWAAVEADSLGYGGQRRVHEATGLSNNTIKKGILELKEGSGCPEINQIRQKGGGRKSKLSTDKLLEEDIGGLVDASTRGDQRWS